MTTAFVLGNGLSRQAIDPNRLRPCGKIYGCNAIHREFVPDVLVATDRPISTAIQESGYALKNKFYTRKPMAGFGAMRVPDPYYGYSSGPIATAIAAQDRHSTVYMLGFDMGPDQNNQFNNLYAGTEFYKQKGALPTFTGNWVKQLVHITSDHPQCQFVRVHGDTTADIPQFENITNISRIDIAEFLSMLDTNSF